MKGDLLRLHLAFLDVDLVATDDNRDSGAHASNVTIPGRNVLVRNARSHVKQYDRAIALDATRSAQVSLKRASKMEEERWAY